MATWNKSNEASRGYTSYRSTESAGVILLSKPAWGGTHPDSFELDTPAVVASVRTMRVAGMKMTKEEQKAKRDAEKARFAALTPQEKADEMRAKAGKKREQAAAALAAAEARLNKIAS